MEKINNICWIVVLALVSFILGYTKGANDIEKELDDVDTSYNIMILDSIKYNIKEKDSVIIKLKTMRQWSANLIKRKSCCLQYKNNSNAFVSALLK